MFFKVFCIFICLASSIAWGSNDQRVLCLKGSPYELGLQHGQALKHEIQRNVAVYLDRPVPGEFSQRLSQFTDSTATLLSYVDKPFIEEMHGVADGSEVPFEKIVFLNLFPELFHCMGVTACHEATVDGSLYHLRVLDYEVGMGLQNSAVTLFYIPDEGVPFVNITFAGFIGSVTGMNAQKIAVGEIGGKGYGYWEGTPMSFVLRHLLQFSKTLNEAREYLMSVKRTCEYYYVLSDGKSGESLGVYATQSQIRFIAPGTNYCLLAPGKLPEHYAPGGLDDKFLLPSCQLDKSPWELILRDSDGKIRGFFRTQAKDCLLMAGWCDKRFKSFAESIDQAYGRIDLQLLQEMAITPDINAGSNLHNVIFHPETLELWVALAATSGKPAYSQPYVHYSFDQFLKACH